MRKFKISLGILVVSILVVAGTTLAAGPLEVIPAAEQVKEKALASKSPVISDEWELSRPYWILSGAPGLKALLGVRHEFDDVFSARLSSAELALLKLTGVKTAPVQLYHLLEPSETYLQNYSLGECYPGNQYPWGIVKVNGGSGGAGIKVAILDTGVDRDHPDLVNNIVDCVFFVSGTCEDGHGHGTHVAGTALANGKIIGVAPEANLMAVKVCDDAGRCWGDTIAAGIYYAADNGANIISMSFGGSYIGSEELAAIDYAIDKGVLLVAAGGNDGPRSNSMVYPAAYFKVMGIAAIQEDETVPRFSSRGLSDGDLVVEERELDLAAPGVSVESTWNDGCYHLGSGTSMATPHVAGLAAKLWQGSASATRNYLDQTLAKDFYSVGHDKYTGFGLPIAPACFSDEDCAFGEICCSGQCLAAVCSGKQDCNDEELCTEDICNNPGTCEAACTNIWPSCGLNDGCCGSGCTSEIDEDCPAIDPCLSCFGGICDDKCHPKKEDTTCPDCQ